MKTGEIACAVPDLHDYRLYDHRTGEPLDPVEAETLLWLHLDHCRQCQNRMIHDPEEPESQTGRKCWERQRMGEEERRLHKPALQVQKPLPSEPRQSDRGRPTDPRMAGTRGHRHRNRRHWLGEGHLRERAETLEPGHRP